MKWETENPTLVKIIGGCTAAVIFVGSTFFVASQPMVGHALFGVATFILGAVGVTLGQKDSP